MLAESQSSVVKERVLSWSDIIQGLNSVFNQGLHDKCLQGQDGQCNEAPCKKKIIRGHFSCLKEPPLSFNQLVPRGNTVASPCNVREDLGTGKFKIWQMCCYYFKNTEPIEERDHGQGGMEAKG